MAVASRLEQVGILITLIDVNMVGGHLLEKRMIGALNIDNDEPVDDSKNYLSTTLEPIEVNWSELTKVVTDSGVWGDIRYAPKIAINVDIRGFEEDTSQACFY